MNPKRITDWALYLRFFPLLWMCVVLLYHFSPFQKKHSHRAKSHLSNIISNKREKKNLCPKKKPNGINALNSIVVMGSKSESKNLMIRLNFAVTRNGDGVHSSCSHAWHRFNVRIFLLASFFLLQFFCWYALFFWRWNITFSRNVPLELVSLGRSIGQYT